MAALGQRQRNRSCVSGSLAHSYEFFYCGELSKDIIITADLFIDSASDFHDRSGPEPTSFEVISDSVGRSATPDQCFEFWGIFRSIFTLRDLQNSVYCRPDDWPDLFTILQSSDMVDSVIDRTSLDSVTGVFAVYKPLGLDNTDHFQLIILFK